jgi:hypothetical protein
MFFRNKVTFSPVEIEYLKKYLSDLHERGKKEETLNQLTIALSKSRNAILKKVDELEGKTIPSPKVRPRKIGRRKDLDHFFRSSWESNFCRYLIYKGIRWEYEPKVFVFEKIKHGTVSYLPDFYLPDLDIYVEVKGQLTKQGKTALVRMKKFYPVQFAKIRYVSGRENTDATRFFEELGVPRMAYYYDLVKEFKDKIKNWE